ncbi:MAG: c-type cytochrome [Terracidiphilus sp.]|jgi:mono/diheme cytochrome c family protein
MKSGRIAGLSLVLLSVSAALVAADGSWLRKVPVTDRQRTNPYAGKPEAIAAGRLLFEENCAKCHGSDAEGRRGRPSLRSERVAGATDGELAWLLRNGSLGRGMPSWISLPEPERWQIIAFLRSLPRDAAPATPADRR